MRIAQRGHAPSPPLAPPPGKFIEALVKKRLEDIGFVYVVERKAELSFLWFLSIIELRRCYNVWSPSETNVVQS